MAVIQLNPRTPGQRFMQIADFSTLTNKEPEKSLLAPLTHSGGRNNRGRMTSRHRGSGHKRRLRLIDFRRNHDGIAGTDLKSLLAPLTHSGGRNNRGRMTSRHRGSGHKRRLRLIDFRRNHDGIAGTVAALEYDPNRSANLALVHRS